jgi:methylthioribulose-1-phosphate dehydratase
MRYPNGIVVEGLEMLKGIGRAPEDDPVRVPVISNSQNMRELGDRFEEAWETRTPAILVAAHGLYAWGKSPMQARHHTEVIEWILEFVTTVSR